MAIGNIEFWIGYVVARDDRTNNARVKVKVFGTHPEDPLDVAAQDLPWAPVVDGTYGAVSTIPAMGEWVFGAHLDGSNAEHPIVLGRVPGYATQMPSGSGFDGDTGFGDSSSVDNLGKVPLHPAVGGENSDQVAGPILASAQREITVEGATGVSYTMPSVQLPRRDLDTRVYTSNDTQNYIVLASGSNGYTQIMHQSGAVIQIGDDGTMLIQSSTRADNTEGSEIKHVQGSFETIVSEGDWTVKVGANGKMNFNGDLDMECENFNLTVRGDSVFNIARTAKFKAASIDIFSHTDNINIVSAKKLKTQSVGLTTLQSEAGLYVRAKDKLDLTAKSMKLTSDAEGIDIRAETDLKIDSWSGVIGIDAATNLHIKGRDNINIEGGDFAHINAPTVFIDDFVKMAEGGADGKYEWQESIVAERAEEDLSETAVAPGLSDPPPSQSPSGYKSNNYSPHQAPTATSNGSVRGGGTLV